MAELRPRGDVVVEKMRVAAPARPPSPRASAACGATPGRRAPGGASGSAARGPGAACRGTCVSRSSTEAIFRRVPGEPASHGNGRVREFGHQFDFDVVPAFDDLAQPCDVRHSSLDDRRLVVRGLGHTSRSTVAERASAACGATPGRRAPGGASGSACTRPRRRLSWNVCVQVIDGSHLQASARKARVSRERARPRIDRNGEGSRPLGLALGAVLLRRLRRDQRSA